MLSLINVLFIFLQEQILDLHHDHLLPSQSGRRSGQKAKALFSFESQATFWRELLVSVENLHCQTRTSKSSKSFSLHFSQTIAGEDFPD